MMQKTVSGLLVLGIGLMGLAWNGGAQDIALAMSPDKGHELTITAKRIAMHSPAQPDAAAKLGALEFVTALELTSKDKDFGGLSSIEIKEDGSAFLALTDRGHWLWAQLDLEQGRPVSVAAARMAQMLNADGKPLKAGWRDSESLTLADGRALVGLESNDRILAFDLVGGKNAELFSNPAPLFAAHGKDMDVPAEMLKHPRNGGLEAMVHMASGDLLAFSEHGRTSGGLLKLWLYKDGVAQSLFFDAPGDFVPTDAAQMPDGDILVLMRRFTPLTGVAALLVRFSAEDIVPGATLVGEELARLVPPLTVDNMEGLAVRKNPEGGDLVYMISDDNFSPLQRTILLVYALKEQP
ncbi:hypothetical protein GCM10007972_09440 [Iodidimonas muriae]|uniref:Phytase-like domain-containing protein n=1 Tax=Iodidimonas muriae TaxID=261467 RepID=A0ABQ2LAP2_9PROT|nr:esterase-like activity of phytase family protein [Iodidimonas muriae]GER06225.1 hypothetical protein JCM17843_05350 [Kordiimonadales bacterium JCM 17843]GGO08740.1 hypothetical protein GCM10007972_09440 [Iodidimonas muriae]